MYNLSCYLNSGDITFYSFFLIFLLNKLIVVCIFEFNNKEIKRKN